jgi:molybdopterin-guanine dinucleotide biosynthesis protein A
MGSDKAFLQLGDKAFIQRACELAESVADSFLIVGAPEKLSPFGPVIPDVHPGRGPLGGLYSALSASQTELNLILAVDLPLLTRDFLLNFRALAEREPAMADVPRVGGRLQPLCAFYKTNVGVEAERLLTSGRNKLEALFDNVSLRVVEEDEIQRLGGSPEMFLNVNAPEDYERAKRILEQRP